MCRDLLSKGTIWKIGNGQNVDFWNDAWLEEVPLNNHPLLSNIKTLILEGCKVSQLISPSKHGRTWTHLNFQNPSLAEKEAYFLLNKCLKVLPLSQQGQDSLIWGKTSNGIYFVSSTYLSLRKEEPLWDLAPKIWIRMLIPKVETFSWLKVKNRILIVDNLVKRGFSMVNRCALCENDFELVNHLFLECPFSKAVLSWVLSSFTLSWVLPDNLSGALRQWSSPFSSKATSSLWILSFHHCLWKIWKERNNRIFKENKKDVLSI
eukprot:Gb_23433 [translate_table: standard]